MNLHGHGGGGGGGVDVGSWQKLLKTNQVTIFVKNKLILLFNTNPRKWTFRTNGTRLKIVFGK